MKAFDLQKALAGAPVVTKRGIRVLRVAHLPEAVGYTRVIAVLEGVSGNNVQAYNEEGHVGSGTFDLFMAPVEKTLWFNLYDSPSFHYTKHDSEQEANQAQGTTYTGKRFNKINSAPIPVVVEE